MVVIYNGRKEESLNALRYRRYFEKVATNKIRVEPKSLPPSSAAANFHSFRVFSQVSEWKTLDCDLQPEMWGWKNLETGLFPTVTDLPPAPDELLKIIRCNCVTDCKSKNCSCQKHGMKCTVACGHCCGSACTNAGSYDAADDAISDED